MYKLLPKEHLLITKLDKYDLECIDISVTDYRQLIHKELKELFNISNKFELQRTIATNSHVNFRYPLMMSFYIKDIIKDKKVMHIGSSTLEHDEGMSHYAKKIVSIEINKVYPVNNRKLYCEHHYLHGDIFKLKVIEQCDVYLFWCGASIDSTILNYLVNKKCTGTFLIGVPQQEDKLLIFLNLIDNWLNNNVYKKVSYITVPFDESVNYQNKYCTNKGNNILYPQFPIKRKTPFTNVISDKWTDVHTFDNQCGVMILLQIII